MLVEKKFIRECERMQFRLRGPLCPLSESFARPLCPLFILTLRKSMNNRVEYWCHGLPTFITIEPQTAFSAILVQRFGRTTNGIYVVWPRRNGKKIQATKTTNKQNDPISLAVSYWKNSNNTRSPRMGDMSDIIAIMYQITEGLTWLQNGHSKQVAGQTVWSLLCRIRSLQVSWIEAQFSPAVKMQKCPYWSLHSCSHGVGRSSAF